MAADIKKLREQIDKVDRQILKLYEERMEIVKAIGEYKRQHDLPAYDAAREDAKLESVFEQIENKEYADGAAQLFITLMQAGREMEEDFLGEDEDFDWDGEPVEIDIEMIGKGMVSDEEQ